MSGLIKKDLLLVKSNLKTVILIAFVFILMAFQGTFDATFIFPFLSIMLFISTFSYDDFNNWNAYACSLPNGRKNVVKSKYIATLIIALVTSLISLGISLIIAATESSINFSVITSSLVGCFLGISIVVAFMYPLIFKYGSEKGRIGLFVIVFLIVTLLGIVSNQIDPIALEKTLKIIEKYLYVVVPIFIILMNYISYKISEKIYFKKEF